MIPVSCRDQNPIEAGSLRELEMTESQHFRLIFLVIDELVQICKELADGGLEGHQRLI